MTSGVPAAPEPKRVDTTLLSVLRAYVHCSQVTWLAVVGSLNADLTLLVDHLPTPGETVVATSPALVSCGGKGGNQAAAAAAFGAAGTMVGKSATFSRAGNCLRTSPLAVWMEAASSSYPALVPAAPPLRSTAMAEISSWSIRAPTACSAPMKSKPQDSPPPRQ